MADCFLSYRRWPSAPVAMTLQSKLESGYGFDVYVDTTRADGTQVRFPERLMQAIEDAPVFICLLGERDGQHTLESDWVLREVQQAFELQKFCIPVFQESYQPLTETTPAIEYLLSFDGVHILDQKNVMVDESVRKLANLIRPHRKKRGSPLVLIGAVVTVALLVAALILSGVIPLGVVASPEPTTAVAQVASETPTVAAETVSANETAIAQAESEQTRLAATVTSSPTSEPSDTATAVPPTTTTTSTPVNPVDATLTAVHENRTNQTATALDRVAPTLTRAAAETQIVQATSTQHAVETQVSNLLATIETWTPIPTDTPTSTPTITPTPSAAQIAQAGIERNADWEPYAPLENDFNGVTMVLVPAGCFPMGSDPDGQQWDGQQWVIGVTDGGSQCFDAPFWIDKHEITNADYGSRGCSEQSDDPRQPRNCVNWFFAQSFCQSREARLPTEAEWEYAARGPDGLFYPWGNSFDVDYVVDSSDFPRQTADNGSLTEGGSWVGALDMSGNVWEWTSSLFGEYPYDRQDGREADAGDSPNVLRSLRGGSFRSAERDLRSATRHRLFPNNTIDDLGFRCARDYQ